MQSMDNATEGRLGVYIYITTFAEARTMAGLEGKIKPVDVPHARLSKREVEEGIDVHCTLVSSYVEEG